MQRTKYVLTLAMGAILFVSCGSLVLSPSGDQNAGVAPGTAQVSTSGGFTDLGGGLYQDESGYKFYLPPTSARPTDENLTAQAAITPACFSASGSYRRLYTKPGTNVNWMSATVSLPNLTSAQVGINATPYIYSGGWSNNNNALDAGFQFYTNASTGGTDWAPFYSMTLGTPSFFNPLATDPSSNQKKLHLKGGQDAVFSIYTAANNIMMTVSPKVGSTLTWLDYTNSI